MASCHKCKSKIKGETGIICAGVCKKTFHEQLKCSGLDQSTINIVYTNKNVKFICEDCVLYIQNVDLVLQNMESAVTKNNQHLREYKNEFQEAIKKNESEIINLLRAIESNYMKRLEEIKMEQQAELRKMEKFTEAFKNQSDKVNDTILSAMKKNDEACKTINTVVNEKNKNMGQTVSFADMVKNTKKSELKMKKELPLIVKPKNKQKNQQTKSDLNTKVDPKNFKIKNIEDKTNGAILIETETAEDREKIKTELEKQFKDKYEIKIPTDIKPQIEIIHMNNKFEETEIVEKLKKQNCFLEMSEIEVVKVYQVKKYNKEFYNAVIEVDKETFPKILANEKVCIGWERCRVFDAINIRRCYKCKGFNHKSADCTNKETCLKCHQEHKTSECSKDYINKCINCIKYNEKLKLNVDVNHKTFSKLCPAYQHKLNLKKKAIGY